MPSDADKARGISDAQRGLVKPQIVEFKRGSTIVGRVPKRRAEQKKPTKLNARGTGTVVPQFTLQTPSGQIVPIHGMTAAELDRLTPHDPRLAGLATDPPPARSVPRSTMKLPSGGMVPFRPMTPEELANFNPWNQISRTPPPEVVGINATARAITDIPMIPYEIMSALLKLQNLNPQYSSFSGARLAKEFDDKVADWRERRRIIPYLPEQREIGELQEGGVSALAGMLFQDAAIEGLTEGLAALRTARATRASADAVRMTTSEARAVTSESRALENALSASEDTSALAAEQEKLLDLNAAEEAPAPPPQATPAAPAPKTLGSLNIPSAPTKLDMVINGVRVKAKSWLSDVLVGVRRSSFRHSALRMLRANPQSELARAMLDANRQFIRKPLGFTMDTLKADPRIWEAGHVLSARTGGQDVLVLQSAYRNQLRSALGERFGSVLSDFALDIDHIAVDPMTAWDLVDAGHLKESTVRSARIIRLADW